MTDPINYIQRADAARSDSLMPDSVETDSMPAPWTIWNTLFILLLIAAFVTFLVWRIDANPVK
jgi:hypothetical protein